MSAGTQAGSRELGGFAKVDAETASDFIERLDRMHGFDGFRLYKELSFRAMRIEPGQRVADIGCGAGDDAARLAQLAGPDGAATGVDLSQDMVDEAGRRFADVPNLDFVCASAESLPFADATFDAVRADRVLIHVPDTAKAMAEMLRILKPGGRLVLTEPDMVGFWVAADDTEVSDIVSRAIAGSCIHPWLPRHMGVTLRDLALDEVEHTALAMVSDDFSIVDRVVRFELVAGMLMNSGKFDAGRIEAWWQDQQERARSGRFTAGLSILMASATRPASGAFFQNGPD